VESDQDDKTFKRRVADPINRTLEGNRGNRRGENRSDASASGAINKKGRHSKNLLGWGAGIVAKQTEEK